jgi:hypothetical protein
MPNLKASIGSVFRARALPPLLFGLCVWITAVGPVLDPNRQIGDRDTWRLSYPTKLAFAQELGRGRLELWDPWSEAGTSILGQISPGLLHPFNALYLALPFSLAFKLNHLLALLLGGIGAALLARRFGASAWGALLAGIVFGGSGALLSASASNLPYALGPAAVPLALAGMLWVEQDFKPLRIFLAGVALALCMAAGDPQSFYLAELLGLLWCAWSALPETWPRRLRRLAVFLTWSLAGLSLSAPSWSPALPQIRRSLRSGGADSSRERAAFSVEPRRLAGIVVPVGFDGLASQAADQPSPFAEYLSGQSKAPFFDSICLAAPALLLAAFGARGRRGHYLIASAALLIVASTGQALGVDALLLRILPGWKWFRYSEKLIAPASALIAVAAARGADFVFGEDRISARRLAIAAVVVAGVALIGAALLGLDSGPVRSWLIERGRSHNPDAARAFTVGLSRGLLELAGAVAATAAVAFGVHRRWGRPLLAVPWCAAICSICAICSVGTARRVLHTVPASALADLSATGEQLLRQAGPSQNQWRVWANPEAHLAFPAGIDGNTSRLLTMREALFPQTQALDGIEGIAPYNPLPDRHFDLALRQAHARIFRLLGVRFWILPPQELVGEWASLPRSPTGFGILEMPTQPRVFLASRALVFDRLEEEVEALGRADLDLSDQVLLAAAGDLKTLDLAPSAGGSGEARLRRPRPSQMEIEVRAPSSRFLVISEHYDPGWKATVDGQPAPVWEADLVAMAIAVAPGHHRVTVWFWPPGLSLGLAILLAGIAILISAEIFRPKSLT